MVEQIPGMGLVHKRKRGYTVHRDKREITEYTNTVPATVLGLGEKLSDRM